MRHFSSFYAIVAIQIQFLKQTSLSFYQLMTILMNPSLTLGYSSLICIPIVVPINLFVSWYSQTNRQVNSFSSSDSVTQFMRLNSSIIMTLRVIASALNPIRMISSVVLLVNMNKFCWHLVPTLPCPPSFSMRNYVNTYLNLVMH